MNRVVVDGYQGGKLMVNERGYVTAFFSRRYEVGGSCQVLLGPVVDDLLALNPGEHLQQNIDGIDDIFVQLLSDNEQPDSARAVLCILSSYWHATDRIEVSQARLREAARWARIGVKRDKAVLQEQYPPGW